MGALADAVESPKGEVDGREPVNRAAVPSSAGAGGIAPTTIAVRRMSIAAGFAEFARLGICRIEIESGTIVEVNDVLAAIYGYEPPELVGADWRLLAGLEHPENEPLAELGSLSSAIADGRLPTSEGERVVTRRDGRAIRVRAAVAVSPGEDGRPRYLTGVAQDVTGLRAVEERIRHQALHDSLTGLGNRTRFAQLIERAAARPESERGWVAVLFLDLTHFKLVNDGLGHLVGDKLLVPSPTASATPCSSPRP